MILAMEVGQWAAMAVALLAGLVGWGYWRWAATLRNLQCQETTPPVPPGSFGWPVVGETLNLMAANRSNNSGQFFSTRVAKYGEVRFCSRPGCIRLHIYVGLIFQMKEINTV